MRANLIYWSVFVGLGVLLWVSSATSSRAFQVAVVSPFCVGRRRS